MQPPAAKLRRDALQIWQAGVEAVRSGRLVREGLHVDGGAIVIARRGKVVGVARSGDHATTESGDRATMEVLRCGCRLVPFAASSWLGRARQGRGWPKRSKRCSGRNSRPRNNWPVGLMCRPIVVARSPPVVARSPDRATPGWHGRETVPQRTVPQRGFGGTVRRPCHNEGNRHNGGNLPHGTFTCMPRGRPE